MNPTIPSPHALQPSALAKLSLRDKLLLAQAVHEVGTSPPDWGRVSSLLLAHPLIRQQSRLEQAAHAGSCLSCSGDFAEQRGQVRRGVRRAGEAQLRFQARQVVAHALGGFFGVAQANGVQQRAVLTATAGRGLFAFAGVGRAVGHEDERGARDQLAQDAPQRLVPCGLRNVQMDVERALFLRYPVLSKKVCIIL